MPMPPRLRYLSLVCQDPSRVAAFYQRHFRLRELGRSSTGEVSLTDGIYNLTFLPRQSADQPLGPHQLGLAIDDLAELRERLPAGASLTPAPGGLHHPEAETRDPNGYAIGFSTSGFGVPPDAPRQLPAIRHVAWSVPQTAAVAEFFRQVGGLKNSAPGLWGWIGSFVADGTTELAILADAEVVQAHDFPMNIDFERTGLNHFGFEASDVGAIVRGLPPETRPQLRTDSPHPEDYYRIWDPEGNHFDLWTDGAWHADAVRAGATDD